MKKWIVTCMSEDLQYLDHRFQHCLFYGSEAEMKKALCDMMSREQTNLRDYNYKTYLMPHHILELGGSQFMLQDIYFDPVTSEELFKINIVAELSSSVDHV